MAYNKINYLRKVKEIQEIVLREQKRDTDQFLKEIFYKHISPIYHISYRTFSNYLGVNVGLELRKATGKPEK